MLDSTTACDQRNWVGGEWSGASGWMVKRKRATAMRVVVDASRTIDYELCG